MNKTSMLALLMATGCWSEDIAAPFPQGSGGAEATSSSTGGLVSATGGATDSASGGETGGTATGGIGTGWSIGGTFAISTDPPIGAGRTSIGGAETGGVPATGGANVLVAVYIFERAGQVPLIAGYDANGVQTNITPKVMIYDAQPMTDLCQCAGRCLYGYASEVTGRWWSYCVPVELPTCTSSGGCDKSCTIWCEP